MEHQVDAVALRGSDGEGVVVVFLFEESFFLVLGEERGVQAQRVLVGEDVVGEVGERAILADERAGTGREVQVARAEVGGVAEQRPQCGGERGVVELGDGVEGEFGCRGGGGLRVGLVIVIVGGGRGGRAGLDDWRIGVGIIERIARGRAFLALGNREVGQFLEFLDIRDDAGVDELLGIGHEVSGVAELAADLQALGSRNEAVVDAESGEPAGVVVHAGRRMARRLAACRGQAKREGGELQARTRVSGRSMIHMKTKTSSRLAMLLALGSAFAALTLNSGCLAVAAGAGAGATVAYVRGDLDTTLNAGYEKSVRAVNAAVNQLQFAKVSENKDALQAIIIARNAGDKKIELRLDKLADDATKLKIRVGTFGDDTLTQAILEKVKANL